MRKWCNGYQFPVVWIFQRFLGGLCYDRWVVTTIGEGQWGSQQFLQGLVSHELAGYLSIFNLFKLPFLESNSLDILALSETNLDDSIDSGNFSVRHYLPLIQKDSSTHIHGLAIYEKEGLLLLGTYPYSADSYLSFWMALLHSVSNFFPVLMTILVFVNSFWFCFV